MNLHQQTTHPFPIGDIENLSLVNYEPAALREWNTGWQIEYRILNPFTGTLEKKRIRFERIRQRLGTDAAARKHAAKYCKAITEKLESGWNPYIEGNKSKAFHKLVDAFGVFLREKELDMKNGVFRNDSMRSYTSQSKMFISWLKSKSQENIYVGSFTQSMAQEYLDHVYQNKELSARTLNNYLAFFRTMWNWLIEKNYCSENIFSRIKSKPKKEKQRVIITDEWNEKIIEYFRIHNPEMELICGLIYNSFMRPQEICRTQIRDIQLAKGGIHLPGSKTKNGKARWCLLPPHLIAMVVNMMKIDICPLDHYLISEGLRPGKKILCTRKINKIWDKMRKAIQLPIEMSLYSYRDTGITEMKTAGHSNLFISSITGHLNSEEIETYTHAPNPQALAYIMDNSKRL